MRRLEIALATDGGATHTHDGMSMLAIAVLESAVSDAKLYTRILRKAIRIPRGGDTELQNEVPLLIRWWKRGEDRGGVTKALLFEWLTLLHDTGIITVNIAHVKSRMDVIINELEDAWSSANGKSRSTLQDHNRRT